MKNKKDDVVIGEQSESEEKSGPDDDIEDIALFIKLSHETNYSICESRITSLQKHPWQLPSLFKQSVVGVNTRR